MATPTQYRKRITELGLDRLEFHVSTLDEAKSWLAKVRTLETQLRQIKREINMEISVIRDNYKTKAASAASSGALLEVFGKRKAAGQLRASRKRDLTSQRDREIAPYQQVKLTIDDLLTQTGSAKTQIQTWMTEAKTDQQS